jgi:hypothetical protein
MNETYQERKPKVLTHNRLVTGSSPVGPTKLKSSARRNLKAVNAFDRYTQAALKIGIAMIMENAIVGSSVRGSTSPNSPPQEIPLKANMDVS